MLERLEYSLEGCLSRRSGLNTQSEPKFRESPEKVSNEGSGKTTQSEGKEHHITVQRRHKALGSTYKDLPPPLCF